MQIEVDKWEVDLILHLISISRICTQRLDVIFGMNAVVVCFPDEDTAIKEIRINRLYLVNILEILQVFLIKLLRKPVPIDIWHCYLGHIGIDDIRNLVRKRLVDGLDIIRNHSLKSVCKDYVFGKIHNLSYNNDVVYEIRILEHIYIDL